MRHLSRWAQKSKISHDQKLIDGAIDLVKKWPGSQQLGFSDAEITDLAASHYGEFRTDKPNEIGINVFKTVNEIKNAPQNVRPINIIGPITLGTIIVHELTHRKGAKDEGTPKNKEREFMQWCINEYGKHGVELKVAQNLLNKSAK